MGNHRSSAHRHLRLVGADPVPTQLDVWTVLTQIEALLTSDPPLEERRHAISLLHSWGWNEMISRSSQERARTLLARFETGRH